MVKEITDQYAAAWSEARGQVQTNVGGVGRSRPQMRVTALDPAVPDALAEYFGLGNMAGAREGGSGGTRAGRPLHG